MSGGVVTSADICDALQISRALLTHVVRLAGVRMVRLADGSQALREDDAALVAGLASALYHDATAERLVKASLATGDTAVFRTQGAALLGLEHSPQQAIRAAPADAILRRDDRSLPHAADALDDTARQEVLAELHACLNVLQSAR